LADEVHNALTRGLNFKLSENEDFFIDFAKELGYTYHVGAGIFSYIGDDDGFPISESILLK